MRTGSGLAGRLGNYFYCSIIAPTAQLKEASKWMDYLEPRHRQRSSKPQASFHHNFIVEAP